MVLDMVRFDKLVLICQNNLGSNPPPSVRLIILIDGYDCVVSVTTL